MGKVRMKMASDGREYEVVDYEKNKGSVGRERIVFIGASYKFIHKVLRDMLLVGGFDDCEIVLLDISPEPLKIVGDLLEKMIAQAGSQMTVTRTMDRKKALSGAAVALLSITVGGVEADVRSWEICHKYGIMVSVGDTLGPAALARNIRTLPVVLDIARDMEKYCPKALLLNFTNPMSCVTGIINRETSIRCMGLCHSAADLEIYFAKLYNEDPKKIEVSVGGVNHQSFVTSIKLRGKERIGTLLADVAKSQATLKDSLFGTSEEITLQKDLYRILGAWPSCGGTHAAEFYKHFLTKRRAKELDLDVRKIVRNRKPEPKQKAAPGILLKWAYGPGPVEDMDFMTTEHAHELMWAVLKGKPYTRVVNILNDGFIAGLPKNACVEVNVTVTKTGYKGKEMTMPTACLSLLQQWTAIHELSYAAARGDWQAARQALFLDPLMPDMYDIEPMLDDFADRLGKWMPHFAKGHGK
jgi:alpha-galactosidase